ncbi:DUF4352 domain-containing protein [Actinomadura sp. CNU-125]|uniref:DUF4352 domain-containing protein n=1 Tax=Actinomadura sp. CNU-125 TaxID=1904961 RepID=UPI0013019AA2|nr:DUF4352 domain-containing protein [Actinomadura sp. CNU-125]
MRRTLQAVVSIIGVQVLVAGVVLLVISSYRRAAAGWVLPLVGFVDVVVTLQVGWLAVRDIRLAGKRTVGVRIVLVLLVVTMLVGAGVGGLAVRRYVNRPIAGAFGSPVMDRDLRITAADFRCGGRSKGITVGGTTCRVALTVANTGSAEALLRARVQRLRGEEGEYPGLLLVEGHQRGMTWELEAGASVRGVLVFDVPRGSVPRSLELRAKEESQGVRLPIPADE